MQAKAVAKFIRVTPRKARQVADLIRGKEVEDALKVLNFCPKAAAKTLSKVVKSAAHNAEHNFNLKDKLFVTAAYVDQGPTLKRFRPRAMGRASSIHKKTSHITVIVGNREEA